MPEIIDSSEITSLFSILNSTGHEYILLRNIGNELPFSLSKGKDIDLLTRQGSGLESFLITQGFKEASHPHQNDVFLYGVRKFKFFHNKKNNILLDLHYELACRSLNAGEWIPLDQYIQRSVWTNCKSSSFDSLTAMVLDEHDELVSLVVRCIFDKRNFPAGYRARISELLDLCQANNLIERFGLVFFKYTNQLIKHLTDRQFDVVIDDYIRFKAY